MSVKKRKVLRAGSILEAESDGKQYIVIQVAENGTGSPNISAVNKETNQILNGVLSLKGMKVVKY